MVDATPQRDSPGSSRPRRTLVGAAFRALAWGALFALLIVVGTFAWEARPGIRPRPSNSSVGANSPPASTLELVARPPTEPSESTRSASQRDPSDVPPDAESAEPISPSDQVVAPSRSAPLAEQLERLEHSVVRLETGDPDQLDSLGSGFVVDRRGWVATNYHVLANSTAARVRLKSGAAYDVAGYVAIDTNWDLAIVALREAPESLTPVELASAEGLARLAPVVAIGHPRGLDYSLFDGKVSRVLLTSQLPPSSQRLVRQWIEGREDQRWVQHTAALSEGNSGGPLLDERGAVVGINTWVDRQARFSYAVDAAKLRELLDAPLPQIAPLGHFARRDARTLELLERLTTERIEALYAQAQGFDWRPGTEAEYRVLQELAWAITTIQLPDTFSRGKLDDRLDQLVVVSDRIVKRLAERAWDPIGQITIVNEHAIEQLFRPLDGVFLFAIVERVVEGDAGTRGALVKVAGSEQMLFVPLDRELSVPDAGLQCLVLGVNWNGHTVRYGDNPLKLITAPVIATRTIVPLK